MELSDTNLSRLKSCSEESDELRPPLLRTQTCTYTEVKDEWSKYTKVDTLSVYNGSKSID